MLRSRCRGVRRADCRRQGILRGCRRQIARGCPVAVLASARSRRLPGLTPGGLWTSPPPAADGTRGRTGREDGALGAISSRASRDNPRRHPPPSAKTASTACAVPGLLQRSVPAGLRPSRPRSPGALSVGCPGVTGVCGRVRRWAAENCSGAAKLGARGPRPACQAARPGGRLRRACQTASTTPRRPRARSSLQHGGCQRHDPTRGPGLPLRTTEGAPPRGRHALQVYTPRPVTLVTASGTGQRTLDPDTMLMSRPEITRPFTRPGERRPIRRQQRPVDDRLAATRTAATAGEDDLTPVPDDVVEHRVGLHTPGHADLAATAQHQLPVTLTGRGGSSARAPPSPLQRRGGRAAFLRGAPSS